MAFQAEYPAFMYRTSNPALRSAVVVLHPTVLQKAIETKLVPRERGSATAPAQGKRLAMIGGRAF
jgi:hypothetical protein